MNHRDGLEESKTKFLVNDTTIEISGSEEFVSRQIELLKDSIVSRLEKLSAPIKLSEPRSVHYLPSPTILNAGQDIIEFVQRDNQNTGELDYENVFVVSGQEISIIADVRGSNTSQKMINFILLYMYAKLRIGIDEVSFKELRDMCEKYGEVDKPNFSKILNQNRKYFLTSGESKSQFARLIRPGVKAAESLIIDLNSTK
jgi:hypothetical protein